MQYIKGKSFQCGQSAVTLGKFDGIHQGHQLLLEAILADPSLTSVLFTFDLNPANLFSEREIRQILTNDERAWLLQETPLDLLIDYPFTMETANTSADTFLQTISCMRRRSSSERTSVSERTGRGMRPSSRSMPEPMAMNSRCCPKRPILAK